MHLRRPLTRAWCSRPSRQVFATRDSHIRILHAFSMRTGGFGCPQPLQTLVVQWFYSDVAHESVSIQLEWDSGRMVRKAFGIGSRGTAVSGPGICQNSECCQISRCNLAALQCLPPSRDFSQLDQSLGLCSPVFNGVKARPTTSSGSCSTKLLHMIAHFAALGCATHLNGLLLRKTLA